MGLPEIIQIVLSDVGTVAILLIILVAGFRKFWVFGWAYQDAIYERDEWRRIALSAGKVADRAVSHLSEGNEDTERAPFEKRRERGRW